MRPIPYTGTPAEARERMLNVLRSHPRTRIVHQEPDYLKAECRSRIFRFVDDVEFVFDDETREIHFRSASRLGRKDFGVNRKRMKEIGAAFQAAGGSLKGSVVAEGDIISPIDEKWDSES